MTIAGFRFLVPLARELPHDRERITIRHHQGLKTTFARKDFLHSQVFSPRVHSRRLSGRSGSPFAKCFPQPNYQHDAQASGFSNTGLTRAFRCVYITLPEGEKQSKSQHQHSPAMLVRNASASRSRNEPRQSVSSSANRRSSNQQRRPDSGALLM